MYAFACSCSCSCGKGAHTAAAQRLADRFQAAIYIPHDSVDKSTQLVKPKGASADTSCNPLQKPEAGTFRVPNNVESAVWRELPTRQGGGIAWLHWHSHHHYQEDHLVFVDIPIEQLGLNIPPYVQTIAQCATTAEAWPLTDSRPADDHGEEWPVRCLASDSPAEQAEHLGGTLELTSETTIAEMKGMLFTNLEAYRARTGRGALLAQQGSVFNFHEYHYDHWYASKPMVVPTTDYLEPNTTMVSIAFFARQFGAEHTEGAIRMHSTMYLHLVE